MSKRKDKKERVKQRWLLLNNEIDNLFNSVTYEPFTEWKDLIEAEIIRRLENERAKDHLFMIDVLKDESNLKHDLIEAMETIANFEYDGTSAEDYAKRKLFELGIEDINHGNYNKSNQ